MQALLITGDTYPNRRELRGAGCVWSRDEGGYLVPLDKAEAARALVASLPKLKADEIEADDSVFVPLEGDALRAYRQDRQDRRAARLLARADAAERRAEQHSRRISTGERDFLSLCEPVKIGHHSEGRHRRLIERAHKAIDAEMGERAKASELRRAADWVMPARIKGDKERARQAKRDEADAIIGLYAVVHDPIFDECIVTKINAKTYTAHAIGRGFTVTVDKHWARFIRQGSAADVPAPKFKAGDKVTATRGLAKWPGVIQRRTARGYSVAYESSGRPYVETFSERCLLPA